MSRRRVLSGLMLFAFIAPCFAAQSAAAQEWARKMFPVREHDFGTVARGAKTEFEFPLENLYMEDVHIAGIRSSCGCTSPWVKGGKDTLKTYENGAIVAHINSDRFLGRKGATLTVTFDKPYPAQVQLHVRAYIRSDVVVEPGSVELGEVEQGQAAEQQVRVHRMGGGAWRVLDVKTENPHLKADVRPSANGRPGWYDLSVKLSEDAPVGYIRDHVLLVTNDPGAREIPVAVEGRVQSSITVSPSSLFLGVVHPGQQVTKQLVVRGKKPFRILKISCEDGSFEFKTPGPNVARPLHLIPVTFTATEGATGKLTRSIRIETDLGEMTLPELPAYAVVEGQ